MKVEEFDPPKVIGSRGHHHRPRLQAQRFCCPCSVSQFPCSSAIRTAISTRRRDEGARLDDLKPFIRDLLSQMERDLDTKQGPALVPLRRLRRKEAGIERAAASMALFERGPRKAPLIGKVVGVGLVDEITDRTWVVVDAIDGRVHYAELGRLQPGGVPARGTLVAIGGDGLQVKPSVHPRVQVLSPVQLDRQAAYGGPTWLDQAILSKWRPDGSAQGFAAEVDRAIAARGRWLVARQLAEVTRGGDIAPKPDMMRRLRQAETERLAGDLSRRLSASYVPAEPGRQIVGVYDRSVTTPTSKLAVIRHQDTFTLAPWRPALEPLKGRAVMGLVGPTRVTWSLDRGHTLPGRR